MKNVIATPATQVHTVETLAVMTYKNLIKLSQEIGLTFKGNYPKKDALATAILAFLEQQNKVSEIAKAPSSTVHATLRPEQILVMKGFNKRMNFGDIAAFAQTLKGGILQAVTVYPAGRKVTVGEEKLQAYFLIDGHRRLEGVKYLQEKGQDFPMIPATVVAAESFDKASATAQQLKFNSGIGYSMLEKAAVFAELLDKHEWTKQRCSDECGVAPMLVSDCTNLAAFVTKELRDLILKGRISETFCLEQHKKGVDAKAFTKRVLAFLEGNPDAEKVTKKDLKDSEGEEGEGGKVVAIVSKKAAHTFDTKPLEKIQDLIRATVSKMQGVAAMSGQMQALASLIAYGKGEMGAKEMISAFLSETTPQQLGKAVAKANIETTKGKAEKKEAAKSEEPKAEAPKKEKQPKAATEKGPKVVKG